MSKRKHKISEEMFAAIPGMIAEGWTRIQIAAFFETTESSLQVQCCRRRISLWRKDRPSNVPKLKIAENEAPLNLHNDYLRSLKAAAEARGITRDQLVTRLLGIIARDNLYAAIIDTDKEQKRAA